MMQEFQLKISNDSGIISSILVNAKNQEELEQMVKNYLDETEKYVEVYNTKTKKLIHKYELELHAKGKYILVDNK